MATDTLMERTADETAPEEPSTYLKYLPGIYREHEFMGRFLRIFESILSPIEGVIDHVEDYFDPKMAPGQLLPWLASWVDLVLDEGWPLEKRRQLIGSAVELYQLRGTRRGLSEYLRIYTGVEPTIVEHFGGIKLGEHSQLGWSTILGDGRDHCFTVTLDVDDVSAVDVDKVVAIIEAEKPAHAGYDLRIVGREDRESA